MEKAWLKRTLTISCISVGIINQKALRGWKAFKCREGEIFVPYCSGSNVRSKVVLRSSFCVLCSRASGWSSVRHSIERARSLAERGRRAEHVAILSFPLATVVAHTRSFARSFSFPHPPLPLISIRRHSDQMKNQIPQHRLSPQRPESRATHREESECLCTCIINFSIPPFAGTV